MLKKICVVLLCLAMLSACASTTELIDEWPDVPEAYWAVLDYLPHAGFPGERPVYFAVADINNDGIPELVLLCADRENIGRYTLSGNEPVRLEFGNFAANWRGIVTADGIIYSTRHSNNATAFSYQLEPNTAQLALLTAWHTEVTENGRAYFQGYDPQTRVLITQEKFHAWWEHYNHPPNPMQFDFVPIERR